MTFPFDFSGYRTLPLSLEQPELSADQLAELTRQVALFRDALVFFTALSNKKGVGGHTGGAYDLVPEVLLVEGLMKSDPRIVPVHYDDAGHRVAIQYLLAAVHGHIPFEKLMTYREHASDLPGHPEAGMTPGIEFSSGRLGHLWAHVNGLSLAHPDKIFVMYSSDGAQQEGDNAEAARFAAARGCNVKVLVDDNDITIAGKPSEYLKGYDVALALAGHGIPIDIGDGEDYAALWRRLRAALLSTGPYALVNRRAMAPGIAGIEGTAIGHDAVPYKEGRAYLEARGHAEAVKLLDAQGKVISTPKHAGSTAEYGSCRKVFGQELAKILTAMNPAERKARVLVIDSDLGGSCGLNEVEKATPDVYVPGGIMERTNFGACAGFGSAPERQGVFGTFAAFQEMCISEIVMARLNHANVLAHFSHSGVDDMSDNTCHFGINNFFAACELPEENTTRLFFPADAHQMAAAVRAVFPMPGLRFVYSTRSSVPYILREDGVPYFDPATYVFDGKDEIIRLGADGYVVAYGEELYRALDAVERLRAAGLDVGLVNKPCLNVPDEDGLALVGNAPFVLVVEGQNAATGLGMRYGTWLLERGFAPRYAHLGAVRPGGCGMGEQVTWQGLGPDTILEKVKGLAGLVKP